MVLSTSVSESLKTLPHKINQRKLALALSSLAFTLIATFYIYPTITLQPSPIPTTNSSQKTLGESVKAPTGSSLPERLVIPKISVDTAIQYVGLTASGAMDVPTNSIDVGWFKLGSIPGKEGSAVIAGHRDSPDGSRGIFRNLRDLQIGDKVYVEDQSGVVTTFVVWQTKNYDPNAQPPEVFNIRDGTHLNLITCIGKWVFGKQSYENRLVVFTSIEKSIN